MTDDRGLRDRLQANKERYLNRQLLPSFRKALGDVLDQEIPADAFMTGEKSTHLRSAFFEIVRDIQASSVPEQSHAKNAKHSVWKCSAQEALWRLVRRTGWHVGTMEAMLFYALNVPESSATSISVVRGVVRVTGGSVLERAHEVWEIVGEDLCLCTEDLFHGFCLEVNHALAVSQSDCLYVHEVTTWGVFSGSPEEVS